MFPVFARFPKAFPQFDWASLASMSQTRQTSVRSLPVVELDLDLQLKHKRIIMLLAQGAEFVSFEALWKLDDINEKFPLVL